MTRREAVFLASRALALLWAAFALVELLYLPERIFSAYHYVSTRSIMDASVWDPSSYLALQYGVVAPGFLLVRIGFWSILSAVFWRCGPGVARLFEPPSGPT